MKSRSLIAHAPCTHGSPDVFRSSSCRLAIALAASLFALAGCTSFKQHQEERYVYVTAKSATLSDRFAAVSNHVGTVNNGDKLTVLERGRHALKVKTVEGTIGWIKELDVADQATADKFEDLKKAHASDPVVATAAALNDVYLHDEPGRKSDHFFRLAEGDNMSLLARATVQKPETPGGATAAAAAKPGEPPPPPAMEDWWLVRDAKGDVGWIYSRMIDVTAPDAVSRYAEGQRIVGSYLLATVDDPDSPAMENGQKVTEMPEYVVVLSPYKAGLPYDFDQVRVFTWNLKKHRYETAYRQRNIAGYLPVKVDRQKNPYIKDAIGQQSLPTFTYRILPVDAPPPAPGPDGTIKPKKLISLSYRLEGNLCRRIAPANAPYPDVYHPVVEEKKSKKDAAKHTH